jgi:RNA polymerase sigma factor for flagellar operon FliA
MLEGTAMIDTGDGADIRIDAYESLAWKQTVLHVMREVGRLSERDQTIIKSHYLDGLDFERVGALLGISKGRVSQLHKAAMALLKDQLLAKSDFQYQR